MSQQTSTLLWVMPEQSAAQAMVAATASDCGLSAEFCQYSQLMERVLRDPKVIVGIELTEPAEAGLALVRELHTKLPALSILVAAHDAGVSIIRPAFEAGACDILSLPLDAVELSKTLFKALARGETAASSAGGGKDGEIITLFGARGGLGVTTLAVNLAVQLARLTALPNVALADFDLQRGDCAAFLNLTPSQSIATMCAASSAIDDLILFSTLIRHASGVSLLAAPQHIEEADGVGPDEVEAAVALLRRRFRFTVVDTARSLTAVTAAVLAQTDRALVMTDLSVPSVRSAHRIFGVLRGLKPREGLDLIIVEGEHDLVPVADAARAIGKEPLFTLPRAASAATAAMNAGTPLNGTKPSPLLVAIMDLASKLSGIQPAATAKRGRLQHLFSRGASS